MTQTSDHLGLPGTATLIALSRDRTSVRCCYSKIEDRVLKCVIVDIDADGGEDWAEQASGEVRWYPFTPSEPERRMVMGWAFSEVGPVSSAIAQHAVLER